MRKYLFILIGILWLMNACSTGEKALQSGNYYDAIMQATERLGNDPNNKKATKVVSEGYPMAIAFYQEEIDRILTGNDPFRWKQTLDIMEKVNRMSDQIRRIPAARQLVTQPKNYTSEMIEVKNRAAEEMYQAGLLELSENNREAAKQAYFHFQNTNELIRGYKDVARKLTESKDAATLKVVVEQIPVNGKFEYSAQFFYERVFGMLNDKFRENDFVNFYSPEEAKKADLKFPDMVLQMGFWDFFIDRPQHFEEEHELTKQIEEKYTVSAGKDSTVTKTRMVTKKGKIKIVTDRVASGGLLEIKTIDYQSNKVLFADKIPGQFQWENKYAIFVGDKQVLDNNQLQMVANKVAMPPAAQDMFVLFTKPIYDQLSHKLNKYFKQYN